MSSGLVMKAKLYSPFQVIFRAIIRYNVICAALRIKMAQIIREILLQPLEIAGWVVCMEEHSALEAVSVILSPART